MSQQASSLLGFTDTTPIDLQLMQEQSQALLTAFPGGVPLLGSTINSSLLTTSSNWTDIANDYFSEFNEIQNQIVSAQQQYDDVQRWLSNTLITIEHYDDLASIPDLTRAIRAPANHLHQLLDYKNHLEEVLAQMEIEAASRPTLTGLHNAAARYGAGYVYNLFGMSRGIDMRDGYLVRKYNKYLYNSTTFHGISADTYCKIGPLVYGHEVQNIRIIEDKAIGALSSVRSDNDFIVDTGEGNADVEITMVFSGANHILAGLRPLIALMKLSPITSVKNNLIKTVLYDKFTESATPQPREELAAALSTLANVSAMTLYENYLVKSFNDPAVTTYEQLKEMLVEELTSAAATADPTPLWSGLLATGLVDDEFSTFSMWEEHFITLTQREVRATAEEAGLDLEPEGTADVNEQTDVDLEIEKRIDRTGHVPMAISGLSIQVSPQQVDTLIATVYLKRISVNNYLEGFLQYFDVRGNKTNRPEEAFWLNRAIQFYVERYIPDEYILAGLKKTQLNFYGEGVELNWFKQGHDLGSLNLSGDEALHYPDSELAVNHLSYTLANKFAFHRLIGEAYPTAQHMGRASGGLSLALTANGDDDDSLLNKIHTYKNAADFFCRHTDRLTRMNGWNVDCVLTRLFNDSKNVTKDWSEGQEGQGILPDMHVAAFFPKTIATSTEPEQPGIRTVNIDFLKTDPDWFVDYGFTISQGAYSVAELWEFYQAFWNRADTYRQREDTTVVDNAWDYTAWRVMFGIHDNPDVRSNLFNPDTLVAAFFTEYTMDAKGEQLVKDAEIRSLYYKIADLLKTHEEYGGKLPEDVQEMGFTEVVGDYLHGAWEAIGWSDSAGLQLHEIDKSGPAKQTAHELAELFFLIDGVIPNEATLLAADVDGSLPTGYGVAFIELIDALNDITTISGRETLHRLLKHNKHVGIQDHYLSRIFTATMRRKGPFIPGIYDRIGLIRAFDALVMAYEWTGLSPDTEDVDDIKEITETYSAMSKSRTLAQRKIFIDAEGKAKNTSDTITTYPDFPLFTFEELFDLPDEGIVDNWMNYAFTYQDMGILNMRLASYGGSPILSSGAVQKAQQELINDPESPVPPSIWFWRERKLVGSSESMLARLDEEAEDYFGQITALQLHIPFDIETAMVDEKTGHISGQKEVSQFVRDAVTNGGGPNPHDTDSPQHRKWEQWSRLIERNTARQNQYYGRAAIESQTDMIGLHVLEKIMDEQGITDEELRDAARDGTDALRNLSQEFFNAVDWERAISSGNVIQPLLSHSHKESAITKNLKFSGPRGGAAAMAVVTQHLKNKDSEVGSPVWDEYVTDMIRRSATGLISAPRISSGHHSKEMRTALAKLFQAQPDNRNDMIKAFPTFRLYFVDFRSPHILIQDNMYGYNAIHSIDITVDKHDADLAVIRIADPYGLLQGTMNGTDSIPYPLTKDSDNINPGFTVYSNSMSELGGNESFLKRMQLKQGRAIQIRGGYSAEPDNLDILFTGRIAEIQFGDIITIHAQGWKAELAGQQVQFELNQPENTSVQDLVTKTIRIANPSGVGTVLSGSELELLGMFKNRLSTFEQINQSMMTSDNSVAGFTVPGSAEGTVGLGPWHAWGGLGRGLDMRLKNIWVPDIDSEAIFDWWGSIASTGWDAERWVVPLQSAWDVLEDATNYVWGYICQVVPYDGEATIFFGTPDQMYFHTKGNNKDSDAYRTKMNATIAAHGVFWGHLFDEFFASPHYTGAAMSGTRTWTAFGAATLDSILNEETNFFTDTIALIPADGRGGGWPSPAENRGHNTARSLIDHDHDEDSSFRLGAAICAARSPDLIKSFREMAEEFGSENTVATYLLAGGFGIDPMAIKKHMHNRQATIVKKLLEPQNVVKAGITTTSDFGWGEEDKHIPDLKAWLLGGIVPENLQGETMSEDHPMFALSSEDIFALAAIIRSNMSSYTLAEPMNHELSGSQGMRYQWLIREKDVMLADRYSTALAYDYLNASNSDPLKFKAFAEACALAFNIGAYDANVGSFAPGFETQLSIYNDNLEYGHGGGQNEFMRTGLVVYRGQAGSGGTYLETENRIMMEHSNFFPRIGGKTGAEFFSALATFLEELAGMVEQGSIQTGGYDQYGRSEEWSARAARINDAWWLEHVPDWGGDNEISTMYDPMYRIPSLALFKSFVYYFHRFMMEHELSTELAEEKLNMVDSLAFDWPACLTMKVFRDHHYIENHKDIIENNIAASTRESYNAVVVRYPRGLETTNDGWWRDTKEIFSFQTAMSDYSNVAVESGTTWATFPNPEEQDGHIGMQFNDEVSYSAKKVAVHTDHSVSRPDQAAKVATNVLTKVMRPMYRNNLMLLGRPMKPWDTIHLRDFYTDMKGPLDIERVVHHYNPNLGWVTNVIPHAYCEANPGNRYVQTAIFANRMDQIMNKVEWVANAVMILLAIPSAGTSLAMMSVGRFAIGYGIKQTAKAAAAQGVKKLGTRGFISATRRAAGRGGMPLLWGLFKKQLTTNGWKMLATHMSHSMIQWGVGEASSIWMMHMGCGKDQLPVILAPLIFKEAPLTAGLEPNEYVTWSVGSKSYWSMRNSINGLRSLFNLMQSDTGVNDPALGMIGNLTALGDPDASK